MENNELQHHGIMGMKWGVRRYQNKDGTLTKAGQKRYNKEMDKLKEEQRVLNNKKRTQAKIDKLAAMRKKIDDEKSGMKNPDDGKKIKGDEKPKKRKLSELSDEELMQRVNRMRLEQQFIDMNNSRNPDPPPQAKSFAKQFMDGAAKPAMINAGKNLLEKTLINKGSELLGLNKKEVKSELERLKEESAKATYKMNIQKYKDSLKKNDATKPKNDEKAKAEAQKQVDDYNDSVKKQRERADDDARQRQAAGYRSGSDSDDSSPSHSSYTPAQISAGSSYVSSNANLLPSKSSASRGESYVSEILGSGASRASSKYKKGPVYDIDFEDVD